MRLIGSLISPFARKVRVVIHELSLDQRITLDPVNPRDSSNDLGTYNPLRKVPTLVLDDGRALLDSPVICHWLIETFDSESRLLPAGDAHWPVLTIEALGDGMLDAAVSARYELLRRESERSQGWIDKQMATVERVLTRLEGEEEWRSREIDLGQITVACLLGWLDFRFPDREWRSRFESLAIWHERISARPSMQATQPRDAS